MQRYCVAMTTNQMRITGQDKKWPAETAEYLCERIDEKAYSGRLQRKRDLIGHDKNSNMSVPVGLVLRHVSANE